MVKKVYWVDLNRFDTKTDKSTWLEMSEVLSRHGYDVTILTGYEKSKYYPQTDKVGIEYFNAIDLGGLFRYSLVFKITIWLLHHANEKDIFILPPGGLYIAPFLRLFRKSNIHLDVRTVPVDIHAFRDKVNSFLFWKLTVKILRNYAKGNSFITDRLRESVEKEFKVKFKNYVIWQSGVNIENFKPQTQPTDKNNRGYTIFYHGTITENRGIVSLVEAFRALDHKYKDKIRLTLIGKGPAYELVSNYVKENNLEDKINLKGFIEYEKIPGEISKADCCICPLPDFPEWQISSPIKIFEYMACGKPLILTPISAHRDVVKGYDFVIWTKGYTSRELCEAIEKAYVNRAALKIEAIKALDCIKNGYTWEIQGIRLAEYFDKVFCDNNNS